MTDSDPLSPSNLRHAAWVLRGVMRTLNAEMELVPWWKRFGCPDPDKTFGGLANLLDTYADDFEQEKQSQPCNPPKSR